MDAAELRRERAAVRLGRGRGRHLQSARRSASSPTCARSGTRVAVDDAGAGRGEPATSPGSPRPRACPSARRRPSTPPTCGTSCPAAWSAPCAATSPSSRLSHLEGAVHRGARPGARGARLADRDDAVRADGADAGGDERDRQGALRRDSRRGDPLCARALRPAQRAHRTRGAWSASNRCRARASCAPSRAMAPLSGAARARRARAVGRGVPAARHHAREPGGCHARGGSGGASLRSRRRSP